MLPKTDEFSIRQAKLKAEKEAAESLRQEQEGALKFEDEWARELLTLALAKCPAEVIAARLGVDEGDISRMKGGGRPVQARLIFSLLDDPETAIPILEAQIARINERSKARLAPPRRIRKVSESDVNGWCRRYMVSRGLLKDNEKACAADLGTDVEGVWLAISPDAEDADAAG